MIGNKVDGVMIAPQNENKFSPVYDSFYNVVSMPDTVNYGHISRNPYSLLCFFEYVIHLFHLLVLTEILVTTNSLLLVVIL